MSNLDANQGDTREASQNTAVTALWALDAFKQYGYPVSPLEVFGDSATDLLLTSSDTGHIENLNMGTEFIFGYRKPQLLGKPLYTLFAPSYTKRPDEGLDVFLRINDMLPLGKAHAAIGLRADGKSFPMEVCVAATTEGSRPVYIVVLRDLSNRPQAKSASNHSNVKAERRIRTRTLALESMVEQLQTKVMEQARVIRHREDLIAELTQALLNVRTVIGTLSVCTSCKHVQEVPGIWTPLVDYIAAHSHATFSHALCPNCITQLYSNAPHDEPEASHDN